nr:MAG TPA: hypothetical protein [Caudoviricetes sp.]
MLLLCNEENKKVWKICSFLKRAFFTYDETANSLIFQGFMRNAHVSFHLG